MEHTPGPWEVREIPERGETLVMGADGNWLVSITGDSLEEGAANARLIAAAPDLLKALIELVQSIEDMGLDCDSEGGDEGIMWLDDDRALIAKAKGE